MNILIFQTGEPLHIDGGSPRPMRAMNLANKYIEKGHKVTLVSSRYYHQEKKHRKHKSMNIKIDENLSIFLIPSFGYKKNVSFSRLFDHIILAFNLKKFLKSESFVKPDLIISGFPPIETAFVLSLWAKKNKIKYILDVKDQWPTILVESFPKFLRFIAGIALSPLFFMAKYTMRNANINTSISKGFLDWVSSFSNISDSKRLRVFPLASPPIITDSESLKHAEDWWKDRGIEKNLNLKIIFIGSFSRAFDFDTLIKSAIYCSEQKIAIEFIICGSGEQGDRLSELTENLDNVKIIDWIDRPKIKALELMADLSIAPYKGSEDFRVSIPNKAIDSLMAGLPIITPLDGDLKNLITKNEAGLFYKDVNSLNSILKLLSDKRTILSEYSKNASNLYFEQFNFDNVYDDFIQASEKLIDNNASTVKKL